MVRLLAFSLLLLGAAGIQYPRPVSPVSAAEFPPNDPLFLLVLRARLTQLASDAARREPEAPQTVRLLARAEDFDGMLQVMGRIVERAPHRMADAFVAAGDALWRFRGDDEQARRRRETLHRIVIDGRKRLPELSREEEARAERLFIAADQEISRDSSHWTQTLQQFVEEYAATEAALLTQVDILSNGRATEAQFEALEAFARQHPGTTAAAKALYEIGFDLHTINTLGTIEPRGADPLKRFERVVAIARELESGRYPPSEWVDRAPSLVFEFFVPRDATFAPESVDRMIAMLTDYAKSHLDLREDHPASNSVIYTLTTKLADLFEKKGERTAGVERVLMDLEKTAAEPDGLRYLRGLLFVQERFRQRVASAVPVKKAFDVLTPLADEGTGLYNRKALATIGVLHVSESDCASAVKTFRRYASSYRESDWRWIALLRAAQCDESGGDYKLAADTYLQIVTEHGDLSIARMLASEYAARAFEALGELPRALALHRQALDAWEPTMAGYVSARLPQRPTNDMPGLTRRDPWTIQKDALSARVVELEQALAVPGGATLERGRWLLASGRYDDAISELRSLTHQRAASAAAAARELSHRAQLMKALQLANLERPGHDRAAAKTALDALGLEPLDFSVVASRIARASLLWIEGNGSAAEDLMRDALDAWHAQQRPSRPAPGIEEDVAAIRRAVFLPGGGGVYGGGRWSPPWPTPPSPFCLVNTDVPVKDHDGKVRRVSLVLDVDVPPRVVFFNTDQIVVLKEMLVQLGGTRRREPRQVMETPNQPVGDSMRILELWTRFFKGRPGHWGGWDLETAPVITEIEFTNAERTKASARVTIGYTGGTVELEKEDGRWIAKRLTNQWIT